MQKYGKAGESLHDALSDCANSLDTVAIELETAKSKVDTIGGGLLAERDVVTYLNSTSPEEQKKLELSVASSVSDATYYARGSFTAAERAVAKAMDDIGKRMKNRPFSFVGSYIGAPGEQTFLPQPYYPFFLWERTASYGQNGGPDGNGPGGAGGNGSGAGSADTGRAARPGGGGPAPAGTGRRVDHAGDQDPQGPGVPGRQDERRRTSRPSSSTSRAATRTRSTTGTPTPRQGHPVQGPDADHRADLRQPQAARATATSTTRWTTSSPGSATPSTATARCPTSRRGRHRRPAAATSATDGDPRQRSNRQRLRTAIPGEDR